MQTCCFVSAFVSLFLLFNFPSHSLRRHFMSLSCPETRAAGSAALPAAAQAPPRGGGAPPAGRAAGRGPPGQRLPQGRRPAPAPPRQGLRQQAGRQAQETQLTAGQQQRDEAEADHPSAGEVLLRHVTFTSAVANGRRGQTSRVPQVPQVPRGEERAGGVCGVVTTILCYLISYPYWPGEVTVT